MTFEEAQSNLEFFETELRLLDSNVNVPYIKESEVMRDHFKRMRQVSLDSIEAIKQNMKKKAPS